MILPPRSFVSAGEKSRTSNARGPRAISSNAPPIALSRRKKRPCKNLQGRCLVCCRMSPLAAQLGAFASGSFFSPKLFVLLAPRVALISDVPLYIVGYL